VDTVALDILDDNAREQMANQTDSIDAHAVNGKTEVQIGWVVGMVIGVLVSVLITVVFMCTWRWVVKHRWHLIFLLSLAAQLCIFLLSWFEVDNCWADPNFPNGKSEQINILNFRYNPVTRDRGILSILSGGVLLFA